MVTIRFILALACLVASAISVDKISINRNPKMSVSRTSEAAPARDNLVWRPCSKKCGGGTMTASYGGSRKIIQSLTCAVHDCKKKDCTMDLVFVVDRSGSMYNEWAMVKQFLLEMVDSVTISNTKVKVGIITYNSNAYVECYLSGNEADIINCINGMAPPSGGTNHVPALNVLNSQMYQPETGDRWWACNVAVVLTDGYGWANPGPAADACRGLPNNIEIYAIGVGPWVNDAQLQAIASDPDSDYIHKVPDMATVLKGEVTKAILKHACEKCRFRCCDIYGDPHYHTFDKEMIHYQGRCTYDLSSHKDGDFSIHGRNSNTAPWSYLIYMHVYHLASQVKLDLSTVDGLYGDIYVDTYSPWKVAKLSNHVSVGYRSWHYGRICVPANYSTQLCGICANYNYQMPDDLRTSNGVTVPDNAAGHKLIGDSWLVYDPLDPYYKCLSKEKVCYPEKIQTFPWERKRHELCEYIQKFQECSADLDAYQEACEMDVNAAGKKATAAACEVLTALNEECPGNDEAWKKQCE